MRALLSASEASSPCSTCTAVTVASFSTCGQDRSESFVDVDTRIQGAA
jgi:hypothetical protein